MSVTITPETIVAGNDFAFSGRYMNADEEGTPTTGINLTGYAITCEARVANAGTLLTSLAIGTGVTLENQAAPETVGGFAVAFLPAQTATWPAGRAVEIDVRIAKDNEVKNEGRQLVNVVRGVTR